MTLILLAGAVIALTLLCYAVACKANSDDPSFAEVNDYKVIDWRKELLDPNFKLEGRNVGLACNWCTCAVGQLSNRIPREEEHWNNEPAPMDRQLRHLGTEFAGVIVEGESERKTALRLLDKIDLRAAEILHEVDHDLELNHLQIN
jgi:hypothetical protein